MMRKIASRAPARGTASIIDPSISYPERETMGLTGGGGPNGGSNKEEVFQVVLICIEISLP